MMEYAIGVDIGGTNIAFIILDRNGKQYDYMEKPTEADKGRKKILENISSGIKSLLDRNKNLRIKGIGIGSPGLINEKGKVVTGAANLKGWNGVELKKFVLNKFKIPVYVENDVTALALGEAMFGAGKNYKNVICLAIGTGLGGGIVFDKRIYRGKNRYAGEFGHIIVQPGGPQCTCGNKGCLETYASKIGLLRLAYKYADKNSLILKLANNDKKKITTKMIFDAFKYGDKAAEKILNKMAYFLGYGMGILVNIFDPDVVIIAGGISLAGNVLIELIYNYVYQFTLPFYKNKKIKIKLSKFRHKAGVIGTASLVFESG